MSKLEGLGGLYLEIIVVTNNPMVVEENKKLCLNLTEVASLPHVLVKARDYIHKNYKLVNHPLVTSIKPYENLYKTVVLKGSDRLDFESVGIIENAIIKAEQFKRPARLNEQAMEDYQIIDLGVFLEAIKQTQ